MYSLLNSVGTDYEAAFVSNAAHFSFSTYDRNRIEEPREGFIPPASIVSEELQKLANVKERFDGLRESKKSTEQKIQTLEETKKSYDRAINEAALVFTTLRSQLFTTGGHNETYKEVEEHEKQLMKIYTDEHINFIKRFDTEMCTLKQELGRTEQELSILYDFITTGAKEIIPEEKRQGNTCSVCIEKPINTCLNPCGHTFCDGCVGKIAICPLCRTKINTTIKLFFTM